MIGDNMQQVAQVLINIPARSMNKAFSYIVPEHLEYVTSGWRVLVPFGSRNVEGFVIEVGPGDGPGLKSIINVLEDEPWFDANMMQTAKWLSSYYLCNIADVMRLFIPGKSGIRHTVRFAACKETLPADAERMLENKPADFSKLFSYLAQHGPLSQGQLVKTFPNAPKVLRYLLQKSLIERTDSVQKKGAPKFCTQYMLAVSQDEALAYRKTLGKRPAQQHLVTVLLEKGPLESNKLKHLKISRDTINRLIASGIVTCAKKQILRDSYVGSFDRPENITLNEQQQVNLERVLQYLTAEQYKSFLLHGITGSGKTQLYIEAVAAARKSGRQAIVLVPEIALTGQIVSRFKASFATDVVVMHSKLSVSERNDAVQRLRSGQAGIVIGARSAVFAPLENIGIIVIDEEHEFTYKQEETPRYHTRQVAFVRAQLSNAVVLLGSATPAIETYYEALQGTHELLEMLDRVDGAQLPAVEVVDMRSELKAGRRSVVSLPLQQLIYGTVQRGEQAIILLNRRGYSTFVLCRECGHIIRCRHCAVSLVYHKSGELRCHYCQSTEAAPDTCPSCNSRYIRYFGTGTQRLEEELTSLFPGIRIARMDQDTTGGKMDHDRILRSFSQGQYDILLGTQMVAKGHDIKNVTAVGIITADSALNLPDFRAAERTFALLTQAAGRAGRGALQGSVVIQTYNPDHYAIQAAAQHDYAGFYNSEIIFRQELFYPPFSNLIKLTVLGDSEQTVHRKANDLFAQLKVIRTDNKTTEIIGPFAAPIAKVNDVFRMNILIKTGIIEEIKKQLSGLNLQVRSDIIIDIEPISVM